MTSIAGDGRIHVIYVVPPSGHFAGIERVVHTIATGLATEHDDNFSVTVMFACAYDDPVLGDTSYELEVLGVDRLLWLGAAVRRHLRGRSCDIIVCPQVEASAVVWAALRARREHPRFVTHLHGNPQVEEQAGVLTTRIAFRLFRTVMRSHLAAVFAVSSGLADYARQMLGQRVPVIHVRNPVRALDIGEGTSERPLSAPIHLVSIGRLDRQKGHDVLLRSVALLRADGVEVRATIAGNGPLEVQLRELCLRLDVADIVSFAGYVPDPTALLQSGDVFVLASRWEGFGVVLVEALQAGLPLVATDCCFGPADVIDDERVGVLVRPENPAELARGVVSVVDRLRRLSPERREAEDHHRRSVAGQYLGSAVIADHVQALRALVDSTTSASPDRS